LIPAALPVFRRLADEEFHISDDLLRSVLAELGERWPRAE